MNQCIICQSSRLKRIFYQARVPVCANAPLAPKGFPSEETTQLDIVMCQTCSHIFNRRTDESIIRKIYKKNYSSGIPIAKESIEDLNAIAKNAVAVRRCKGLLATEIGSSDFTFSEILLHNGIRRLIAFEPSDLFTTNNASIVHIKEYFSAKKIPHAYRKKIGLLVARHVLEHTGFPIEMLRDIASLMSVGSSVYIEVPNVDDILNKERVYDFFYEHVSYFSPALLRHILKCYGFQIIRQSSLKHGQHFGLLCKKVRAVSSKYPAEIHFPPTASRDIKLKRLISYRPKFKRGIARISSAHKSVAIYGAGNHGIALSLWMNPRRIKYILDLNPLKAGFYSPLRHLPIRLPFLGMNAEIDAIVIAASLYEREIHAMLRKKYLFSGKIYGTCSGIKALK